MGENTYNLRANPCFVAHLKRANGFTIMGLTNMLKGDRPTPGLRLFREDFYLKEWARRWQNVPAIATGDEATAMRQRLSIDLITYGCMERRGDVLERSVRFSFCLNDWVKCEEVIHCWECTQEGMGCFNKKTPNHWHCVHKPFLYNFLDKACKCGNYGEVMGRKLGLRGMMAPISATRTFEVIGSTMPPSDSEHRGGSSARSPSVKPESTTQDRDSKRGGGTLSVSKRLHHKR